MKIPVTVVCALALEAGSVGICAQPLDDPIPEPIEFGDVEVQAVEVASGFAAPLHGAVVPGDTGRLFIVDQVGVIYAVDLVDGDFSVFLDITARTLVQTNTYDERGFLGLVFHPEYADNGLLYTYTSETTAGAGDFPWSGSVNHQSVIAEWRVDDPADPASVVNTASRREIIRIDQPSAFHNAGALAFDNDGYLLISLGNGGPLDTGQDPSNVLGSILRIDVTGSDSVNGQYGIPASNPFVGMGGFVPEIFATGFRNPFRITVDIPTGDIWGTDVGNNDIEEVDLVIAGNNYGFNIKEGSFCFVGTGGQPTGAPGVADPSQCDSTGLTDPVAEYDHDEGVAVIGGYVYHGQRIKDLDGSYVFGDNNGRLFYLDDSTIRELRLFNQASLGISVHGMGQGADNELYVIGKPFGFPLGTAGRVFRLDSGPGRVAFSADLYVGLQQDGFADIRVARSGGLNGVTTVRYSTADGTATAGEDYLSTSGELIWLDGEDGEKSFQITIIRGQFEGPETFTVNLTDPSAAPLGDISMATVEIELGDTSGSGLGVLFPAVIAVFAWRRRKRAVQPFLTALAMRHNSETRHLYG